MMEISVLLVEDNEEDSFLIRKMLMGQNDPSYRVARVTNYNDAIKLISLAEHDVYLVDYKLTDGDGLQLIQQAISQNSSLPMILLTGFSSREIDDQAIAKGASDYIPKEELSASVLDRGIRHAIERKAMEEKLLYLANYDVLTGLANRNLLQHYFDKSISRAQRKNSGLALLFIDLNRFKLVNDSLGHTMGDYLLVDAAKRIKQSIRKEDVLARIGGDKFILLIDDLQSSEQASCTASKIIEVMSIPYELNGHTMHLSASIGIAIGGRSEENIEVLMKNAGIALTKAKSNGRNQACFFNDDMNNKLHKNLEIEKGLHHALANDQFQLVYQPQVNLATFRMSGCEALIRWKNSKGTLFQPVQFLPIAMDTGLIIPIGEWIIKQALTQAKLWKFDQHQLKVCINIAPQQLKMEYLPEFILEQLDLCQFPPHLLELEITEDVLIEDLNHSRLILSQLRNKGVSIAIDDFGTGYSSLSYLKDLPFDVLKVDKSFIMSMLDNNKNLAITDAVINLAHKLNISVIAEGVETLPQLDALATMKCDSVQGYLFSKPLSPQMMEDVFENDFTFPHTMLPKPIVSTDIVNSSSWQQ